MSAFHFLSIISILCTVFLTSFTLSTAAKESKLPTWGTLRPHALISARAPVPHSPFFGFAYHPASSVEIRHLAAEHTKKISSFTWTAHDGRNFGDQEIRDHDANLLLTTTFYAHPSHSAYTLRISAVPLDPSKPVSITSVILYAVTAPDDHTTDDDDKHKYGSLRFENSDLSNIHIRGDAPSVGGPFSIHVSSPTFGAVSADMLDLRAGKHIPDDSAYGSGSRSRLRTRSERPSAPPEELGQFHTCVDNTDGQKGWAVEKTIEKKLSRQLHISKSIGSINLLSGSSSSSSSSSPVTSALVQRLVEAPFQMEATLIMDEDTSEEGLKELQKEITGSKLDTQLRKLRKHFDEKFETVFSLKDKEFTEQAIAFGKQALANVLGGIGYFYGSSLAREEGGDKKSMVLPPVGLYTATPSRIVFPRGFLWDEGFHQLIIQRWDPNLSARCLQSWFSVSQSNGWIPREQILGFEARNRFPSHVRHLIIQNPIVANPPTILMPLPFLWTLMQQNNSNENTKWKKQSEQLLQAAEQYYKWIKTTQAGERPLSFRWRGRSSDLKSPDGYPLTLSSGLDDYPRALSVSKLERHVDLHCWITWASQMIARMLDLNGKDSSEYEEEFKILLEALDTHHSKRLPNSQRRGDLLFCDYDGDERVCHEGYVTILPLLLGLLDEDDERVGAILDALEDDNNLRATAGVRSLSRMDRWHRRGDDYWTGSIWMPFNFLTLAALKTKYGANEGRYRDRALRLYSSLRDSIIENTIKVHADTGVLWENYSPEDDGAGKSGRQFTGWTSLVLMIMAEKFDGVI